MFAVRQFSWGLVCIHLLWIYFFITGTLVRSKRQPQDDLGGAHPLVPSAMADLVITTATGMAITGFVVLILGFIGLLNARAFLLWIVIEGLLFRVLKNENIFQGDFWRSRLKLIKSAWSLPSLLIYFIFLIISVPAILPPILWDDISYHLAYAVEWANTGHIYVDQFLRFPYYANNFLLIYALMFALKLGYLCHFMTWLCGLLTGLGIYALIAESGPTAPAKRWLRVATETILPLALALSPTFLRWVDTGFIDVPIGFFTLVPVLCTYLMLRSDKRNYQVDLVIVAAFCVGMKISLFLCLPLFIFSLVLVLHRRRRKVSELVGLCALLLLLSAPWYVRNFIAIGDPIPPVFNLMIRGHDPIFTQADYTFIKGNLGPPVKVRTMLLLPIKLFLRPGLPFFGEFGTNLSVILLYLPLVTILLAAIKSFRTRVGTSFIYLNFALVYLLGNWLGISTIARYGLQLFPVYLGYLGISLNIALTYFPTLTIEKRGVTLDAQVPLTVLLLALLYPSPASRDYYNYVIESNYVSLAENFPSDESYLRHNLPGYISAQAVIDSMYANGSQQERVLTSPGFEDLSFYFRRRNMVNVGDYFGPGRYDELIAALDNSDLASYLAKFNIGAALLNPKGANNQRLAKQLELQHFALQPNLEAGAAVYLKTK